MRKYQAMQLPRRSPLLIHCQLYMFKQSFYGTYRDFGENSLLGWKVVIYGLAGEIQISGNTSQ